MLPEPDGYYGVAVVSKLTLLDLCEFDAYVFGEGAIDRDPGHSVGRWLKRQNHGAASQRPWKLVAGLHVDAECLGYHSPLNSRAFPDKPSDYSRGPPASWSMNWSTVSCLSWPPPSSQTASGLSRVALVDANLYLVGTVGLCAMRGK